MKNSSPAIRSATTLTALLTGATIGLQLMLIAMLLGVSDQYTTLPAAKVGALKSVSTGAKNAGATQSASPVTTKILDVGREHDAGFYVLFSIATLIGMALLARNTTIRQETNPRTDRAIARDIRLRLALLTGAWIAFLALFSIVRMQVALGEVPPPVATIVLCAPLALYRLFLNVISRRQEKTDTLPADAVAPVTVTNDGAGTDAAKPALRMGDIGFPLRGLRLFDIAAVIFIFAFVYIPDTGFLSTHTFRRDEFHHWNFFAMGPALGFSHGRALGTEVYSQYGVGWPMFFSFLAPLRSLSYGHMMQAASLYGCFYFMGLYLLLRMLLKNPVWASCGILWAWYLQFFQSGDTTDVIWEFPSASIMRAPFDIWLFIVLLMHARTGKTKWLLGAAVLLGLSVIFELDTSIYLVVTSLVYCGLMGWQHWREARRVGKPLLQTALCGGLCTGIVLAGLWIASRGTLASGAFWTGWLEAVLGALNPDGSVALLLPLATYPDMIALGCFVVITLTYLLFIGATAARLLLGQSPDAEGRIIVCIACYGLMAMMLFIGRSNPLNLFHPIIPFCIVSTCALAWGTRDLARIASDQNNPSGGRLARFAPTLALAILAVLILRSPSYQIYGSAFKAIGGGNKAIYASQGTDVTNGCLLQEARDVCGIRKGEKHYFQPFEPITAKMLDLAHGGNTVAVLDDSDTILYLATGLPPWPRYSPIMPCLSPGRLAAFLPKLRTSPPDYVLIRKTVNHTGFFNTKAPWLAVRAALPSVFEPNGEVGPFEIWRKRDSSLQDTPIPEAPQPA